MSLTKKHRRIIFFVIIVLSFIYYGNTIGHDYTLDDSEVITGNEFIEKGVSGIYDIFANNVFSGELSIVAGGRYRPLSIISFAIEYQFFGGNPNVSHFINILLYAISVYLLFLLVFLLLPRSLIKGKKERNSIKAILLSLPFLSALFFLVHPVHTEVVANIKGRDEILAFLFSLLSLYIIIKNWQNLKLKYFVLSGLSFFLALLSKENSASFLIIIPATIFVFREKNIKQIILKNLHLILIFAVFMLIRQTILHSSFKKELIELMNHPFLYFNTSEKYATIFFTLLLYIKLLIFPHPLTYDYYPYHIDKMQWNDFSVILSLLIYGAIISYILIRIWKKDIIAWFLIIYLVPLLIVSNLFIEIGAFMGERFIYFSSFSFTLFLAYIVVEKLPKYFKNAMSYRKFIYFLLLIIIISSAIKTISRNKDWKSNETLFLADVKTSYKSAKSNAAVGEMYMNKFIKSQNFQQFDSSVHFNKKALEIHLEYGHAINNLAYIYYWRNTDSTLFYYKKLLKLDDSKFSKKSKSVIFNNVSIIAKKEKNTNKKFKIISDFYKIDSNNFELTYSFGKIYKQEKNNLDSAIIFFKKAYKINSQKINLLYDMGLSFGMKNNYKEAEKYLLEAYKLDSNNVNIIEKLAFTYTLLGNKNKMKKFSEKIK